MNIRILISTHYSIFLFKKCTTVCTYSTAQLCMYNFTLSCVIKHVHKWLHGKSCCVLCYILSPCPTLSRTYVQHAWYVIIHWVQLTYNKAEVKATCQNIFINPSLSCRQFSCCSKILRNIVLLLWYTSLKIQVNH